MNRAITKSALALAIATASLAASASPILFVSDTGTDLSIATALTAAGHSVTSLTHQFSGTATAALKNDLSSYAAVYWSATGEGYGGLNSDPEMLANLTNYVTAGGRVFVTGYDSIVSPNDTALQTFLGGKTGLDLCEATESIADVANRLTTGFKDIRGMQPGRTGTQSCDRDALGELSADTVGIAASAGRPGYYQWTLRSLGLGEIAYVSNGNSYGDPETTMWTDGSAYHAALLNFAVEAGEVPEPGILALLGLGLAGFAASRRKSAA